MQDLPLPLFATASGFAALKHRANLPVGCWSSAVRELTLDAVIRLLALRRKSKLRTTSTMTYGHSVAAGAAKSWVWAHRNSGKIFGVPWSNERYGDVSSTDSPGTWRTACLAARSADRVPRIMSGTSFRHPLSHDYVTDFTDINRSFRTASSQLRWLRYVQLV